MTYAVDHLVYGAPELDAAVDDLEQRLGVRAAPGGKHVGLGTHNALLALGPRTYLEVIAPDPEQPAPTSARPFDLDALAMPRVVGWAIGCDDIDAAIARSRARGYDPGPAVDMARTTANGTVLQWQLTLNAIGGGAVPFLIAWGVATEHPAESAPKGLVLEALELEHPEPEALAAVLQALGTEADITPGREIALVARVRGPAGTYVLR